ncbi:hypothetical protein [Tahibacter sp.]|uniref:hypothetical protein n=1 Tax=Tahibacter sp. TaxID=2056211 RepID=UPI002D7EA810|nr:hypothetical protein [Tahibacter sp.]
MSIRRAFVGFFLGTFAAHGAHAVMLNAHGQGQVLIWPYYTTAAGNASLITLTNHLDRAKIVQLRVAEGENGRSVAALNVYLAPHDSWTAALFDRGENESPGLLTDDPSCTYPQLSRSNDLPQLPDGRRYLPLSVPIDAGSSEPRRVREGYVEAVELAAIVADSATASAITPAAGGARDCLLIEQAWTAPAGYWTRNPLRDLTNPGGGLSGSIAIVNVAAGTLYGAQATALDEFRVDPEDRPRGTRASVAQHFAPPPGVLSLLGSALSDPATGQATALLIDGGRVIQAHYPSDRALDAVSAVLMAARLSAPSDTTARLGATTSFALTYPTRAHYTDPQLGATAPRPPFQTTFRGVVPLAQSPGHAFRLLDREGAELFRGPLGQGALALRTTGTAVELVSLAGVRDSAFDSRLHGHMGTAGQNGRPVPYFGDGQLIVEFDQARDTSPVLPASLEGYRLAGLPVIGTRFTHYTNQNAAPGVLATYAEAAPMQAQMRCSSPGGGRCADVSP